MFDSFEIDESLAGRCENFGVLFNKLEHGNDDYYDQREDCCSKFNYSICISGNVVVNSLALGAKST